MKYPDELHGLHNDYLLAPEKLEISHNMMSNYCSNIANKYDIKMFLCSYVLHFRILQLYILYLKFIEF